MLRVVCELGASRIEHVKHEDTLYGTHAPYAGKRIGNVPSPPGDTPPPAPPREPSWAEVRSVLAGLYVTGVTEMYRESFCVVEHLRRGLMPPLCDCDAKAGPVLPLHKETHGVPHLEAGLPPDMLAKNRSIK
jgi:hypothetical protein